MQLLSLRMESDSVFHNLFVCMESLPVLSAVLPIPSLSALSVHRANQVFVWSRVGSEAWDPGDIGKRTIVRF